MPADNRFWFDENQNIAPCWSNPAEQNPKHSILDSELRARLFSLEYPQLLTQGKDLQAKAATGTEEGVEEGENADEKGNHRSEFIA